LPHLQFLGPAYIMHVVRSQFWRTLRVLPWIDSAHRRLGDSFHYPTMSYSVAQASSRTCLLILQVSKAGQCPQCPHCHQQHCPTSWMQRSCVIRWCTSQSWSRRRVRWYVHFEPATPLGVGPLAVELASLATIGKPGCPAHWLLMKLRKNV
jgi:hypothetical protein